MSWSDLKEEGNKAFADKLYDVAERKYSLAIKLVKEGVDFQQDVARLLSNRSATFLQMGLATALAASTVDETTTNHFLHALSDGNACIEADPAWGKGHFRVAKVLFQLHRRSEGLDHLTKIIDQHHRKGTDYKSDRVLLSLLSDYKYFQQKVVHSAWPCWQCVKYKDNCLVLDPNGAGDVTDIQSPMLIMNKVSLLVLPGLYRFMEQGLIVTPEHDIDIVGVKLLPGDEIVFETTGEPVAPRVAMDHTVTVVSGNLNLTGVTVKQAYHHPERHGVLVVKGGKCIVSDCKFWSKASACMAAVDRGSKLIIKKSELNDCCGGVIACGRSKVIIDQSQIVNSARIGVEIRDGGFITIKDSTISNSGRQGLACHAYGEGFHIQRCTFRNNSCNFGDNEASISVASGKITITDCQILNNKGTGLSVDSGSLCMIKDSQLSGNKVGMSLCHGCTAHITNNEITDNQYGLVVLYNLGNEVLMENNTIQAHGKEIVMTKEDTKPSMTGTQHSVEFFQLQKNDKILSERLKLIMRQRKQSKYRQKSATPDPRDPLSPSKIRMCPGCGLSEHAKHRVFKKCSACKAIFYCSPQCQKKHWEVHKNECRVLREVQK